MKKNYFMCICICFITLLSCSDDTEILNVQATDQRVSNLGEAGLIEIPGGEVAKEIPVEIFNLIIHDLENKSNYSKVEKIRKNYTQNNGIYILNNNIVIPASNITRSSNEFAIEYRSHIEDIGWTNYSQMGEITGTTGLNKRLEALQFRYKGQIIPIQDFKVRSHVTCMGWLPWVVIGDITGTTGLARQIEAVQVSVSSDYNVYYRAHVWRLGWLPYVFNNEIAGTTQQDRRMEAFQLFMFKY